ncbi:MAG: MSCRAMM family protein [Thermoleophilia bacterium]
MAGSIARQPWRLGLILLVLASFVVIMLMAQMVFSGSPGQVAQISETGAAPVVTEGSTPTTVIPPVTSGATSGAAGFSGVNGADTYLPSTFVTDTSGSANPGQPAAPNQPANSVIKGFVWQQKIPDGPLGGVMVYLADAANNTLGPVSQTDDQGGFRFPGLAPGDYKLFFFDPGNRYKQEWYHGTGVSPLVGTTVHVDSGESMELLYMLTPIASDDGAIAGFVTDSSGGVVAGAGVLVYRVDDTSGVLLELKGSTTTDAGGYYTLQGLQPTAAATTSGLAGSGASSGYKVLFTPPPTWKGYAPQWYQGQSTYKTAKLISVHPYENVLGINAVLTAGGTMAGQVKINGTKFQGALVDIFDESGIIVDTHVTDGGGFYKSATLAPGKYRVRVTVPGTTLQEWYTNKTDFFSAEPVEITGGSVVSGINVDIASVAPPAGPGPAVSAEGLISPQAVTLIPGKTAMDATELPAPAAAAGAVDGSGGGGVSPQQPKDGVLPTDKRQGKFPGQGGQDQVPARQPQVDGPREHAVQLTGQRS